MQYNYADDGDTSKYRFGFNTQERDDEIAGEGNIYSAEFWEYDARIGRRFNTDPVVKKYESSYACLGNNPLLYVDFEGNDSFVVHLNQIFTNESKKSNTILLQATLYSVKAGIWKEIELATSTKGTNIICFAMPASNYTGHNKMKRNIFYNTPQF